MFKIPTFGDKAVAADTDIFAKLKAKAAKKQQHSLQSITVKEKSVNNKIKFTVSHRVWLFVCLDT